MRLAARPASGRVILLFQPAEETGVGAQAILEDERWSEIRPDYAFAYHNVPGRPLGEIGLCPGHGNCASRGMRILLEGKSSHAAAPEDGLSPAGAMADLIRILPSLGGGIIGDDDFALCTLTHARLGEPTFGVAPADGELLATLRTTTNERMEALISSTLSELERAKGNLKAETEWHDVFPAVFNDYDASCIARKAAADLGLAIRDMDAPMRWSEDFGRIGRDGAKAALLYIGSGENQPQLHNPDFDFPDTLLPIAIMQFCGILDRLLGPPSS